MRQSRMIAIGAALRNALGCGLGLMLAACGGSSESSGQAPPGTEGPNSGIGRAWISSPSQTGTYTTVERTVRLKGGSFTPPGSTCPTWTGVLPPGFSVTWSNALNRCNGTAFTSLNCVTIVLATWDTGDFIPLDLGANVITVTADDGAGNVGRDTITVTRVLDTTPPTVVAVSPVSGSTGVGLDAVVVVTFSEAMDPTSITADSITLGVQGGQPVAATVTYDVLYQRATLTPSAHLAPATTYVFTVTPAARDKGGGNPLAAAVVSTFGTGSG